MNISDSLKLGLDTADMVTMAYLGDLNDEDLMKRPHPQCNHLNWQIGHLIASEYDMLKAASPNNLPALPTGFAEKYTRETQCHDDPTKFCSKAELMSAYQAVRKAAIDALGKIGPNDWTKETGISYAPTIASLFTMMGGHWLMHCGQWVIVRRQLGKAVVI